MNQQCVDKIKEFMASNGLELVEAKDAEYGENSIILVVPRATYAKVIDTDFYLKITDIASEFDNFVSFYQQTPTLVEAKVGEFVLIYNKHQASDEDSHVGIVSSKILVTPEGKAQNLYGCRYILIGLGNSFVPSHYHFVLSEENYGGFHKGFLKTLKPDEVIEILKKRLEFQYEEEKNRIEDKKVKTLDDLPNFINTINGGYITTNERLLHQPNVYLPGVQGQLETYQIYLDD